MPNDAKRFRDRAMECRALAKGVRHDSDAALLEEIAEELDDEARKLDAELKLVSGPAVGA
jgi:hypothetical protein